MSLSVAIESSLSSPLFLPFFLYSSDDEEEEDEDEDFSALIPSCIF